MTVGAAGNDRDSGSDDRRGQSGGDEKDEAPVRSGQQTTQDEPGCEPDGGDRQIDAERPVPSESVVVSAEQDGERGRRGEGGGDPFDEAAGDEDAFAVW